MCANASPTAPTIPSGLYWSIKESFVSYIATLPDGTYSLSEDVEVDDRGVFRFPLAEAGAAGGGWSLSFTGDVRFGGHVGMLFVAISHPTVTFTPVGGSLTIDDLASPKPGARLTIARLPAVGPSLHAGILLWPPLTPLLTEEGAELFGGAYAAGSTLDQLRIAARPATEAAVLPDAGGIVHFVSDDSGPEETRANTAQRPARERGAE
jgi:hypothetical protein